MQEHDICPWCLTEIVWDEEIGPEQHCPHCENELGGYRTVELGGAAEHQEEMDKDWRDSEDAELDGWKDDEGSDGYEDAIRLDQEDGFRHSDKAWLAVESNLQSIIDGQDEMPECPICREYMLEMGTQTVAKEGFQPAVNSANGQAVMDTPFKVVWYVCPACFHTSSMLGAESRDALLKRLES